MDVYDWGGALILEEDDFGRVMFAYVAGSLTSDRPNRFNLLAVLIAQRTTRSHSYFYDGFNVILYDLDWPSPSLRNALDFFEEDFVMEHFTEEQLEQLKEENSWNEELDEDRFFRVPVSRRPKTHYMTYVSDDALRSAFRASGGGAQWLPGRTVPLTMDKNGNVIYFMRGWGGRGVLLMFDGDGNWIRDTAMELYDLWDYRDQLREFKEAHGWSFTYR